MDIEPKSRISSSDVSSRPQSLLWDGTISLSDPASGFSYIQLQERTFNILKMLSDHANVNFQFLLEENAQDEEHTSMTLKNKVRLSQGQRNSRLSVILYGHPDMAGAVGCWLDKCHLYLQMPENCDQNVPYCNPHCLSFSDKNQIMTFELSTRDPKTDTAGLFKSTEFLAELIIEDSLEEASQPSIIASSLHK